MENNISDRIRKLLDYKGLTQNELAEMIGLSGTSVGHWINGRNEPKKKALTKIAFLFKDVSETWLFYGQGEMLKPKENFVSERQEGYGIDSNFIETPLAIKFKDMAAEIESLKKELLSKEELLKAKDEIIELLKKKN